MRHWRQPQFELYEGSDCIGTLKKEPWGWFKPRYNIDFNGWHIEGDWTEWDYTITGPDGEKVAAISNGHGGDAEIPFERRGEGHRRRAGGANYRSVRR